MEIAVHRREVNETSPENSNLRDTIPCTDPASLLPLGQAKVMGQDEVNERVRRARLAQRQWAETSFPMRKAVLRRLLAHFVDHIDDICEAVARDAGKTRENALLGEIFPVCEKLRHTIEHGERHLRPERVSSGLLVQKTATIEYPPLGVIGVICPWNFPFQNILGPVIPALFAGNAVVVKVSEWTTWSSLQIEQMIQKVLREAGHSPDLVQIVTGYGETGAALVGSGVDKIIFTGSVQNGRKVLAESARTLTPVILELGGKDPMIICDDADLDRAVAAALAGVFISSGQMCLAAERVYVFDEIYDRFVGRVIEEVRALKQGPPFVGHPDVGAMTMPQQLDIVEKLVADAVARGARVQVGGKRNAGLRGQFFEPTVLTEVDHSMAITREETFGPVMCIMRVRTDDEAVRLANDSEFGLGSTVFSKDLGRAQGIARRIQAGSSCINDFSMAYVANDLPFGGIKHSGFGRLNGREGLRACTNIKSVLSDRVPLGALAGAAKLYPVKPGDYEQIKEAVELLYRSSLFEKGKTAVRMVQRLLRR